MKNGRPPEVKKLEAPTKVISEATRIAIAILSQPCPTPAHEQEEEQTLIEVLQQISDLGHLDGHW